MNSTPLFKTISVMVLAVVVSPLGGCRKQVPDYYACTPDFMRIERHENGLKVTGRVVAPSPGYFYVLRTNQKPWVLAMAQQGEVHWEVVSNVDVREIVEPPEKPFENIVINIDRDYKWGSDTIVCEPVVVTSARRDQAE